MPEQRAYFLDEQTIKILQSVINQVKKNTSTTKSLLADQSIRHKDYKEQDVFIARTPPDGIPGLEFSGSETSVITGTGTAGTGTFGGNIGTGTGTSSCDVRNGDTPGYADNCILYRIDRVDITVDAYPNCQNRRVYNLSTTAIEGNKYILAIKEKHGNYIALDVFPDEEPDVGTGTEANPSIRGGSWVAGLCRDDCLKLTVRSATGNCSGIDTTQIVYLTSVDGDEWLSTEDFVHCLGQSTVTFSVEAGIPTLLFGAFYAVYDGGGYEDGEFYIDFAISKGVCNDCQYGTGSDEGTGSGSGTSDCGAQAACGQNLLVVRLVCGCPPDETVTVAINCEGCTSLPSPMTATLTGTGDLSWLTGETVTIEWEGQTTGVVAWSGSKIVSNADDDYTVTVSIGIDVDNCGIYTGNIRLESATACSGVLQEMEDPAITTSVTSCSPPDITISANNLYDNGISPDQCFTGTVGAAIA